MLQYQNMDSQLNLQMQPVFSPRQNFLFQLQSTTDGRYKRYNGLPLRYAGGKSLAVGYILEYIPDKLNKLISPFMGGGSVEIACAKELGLKVMGYDLFDLLVNYWQIQIQNPHRLANLLSKWEPTKKKYQLVKKRLNSHWNKEKPITDRIELAAHYWFNHNLSYGPGFLGWMSSIYECSARYQRLLKKVNDFKPGEISVKQATFEKIIPLHKKDFLYCDPPYYLNGDSKMFRGIYPQRNFPLHHNGFRHDKLRELLKQHQGGFILSYNDCKTIRNWYSDFEIKEVSWQYTMGQGETRIGKNRIASGGDHTKKSHELLILGN